MASATPERLFRHRYTYEEYLAYERDSGLKHEFEDGEIVAMAGGSRRHNALASRVSAALETARGRGCVAFQSDQKVRVLATGKATYPETTLVLVRKRGADRQFAGVTLGCAGAAPLSGWADVGDYQYTRVDLVTGDFQPVISGCDNGRQTLTSAAPFDVTVWGWGSAQVLVGGKTTAATSYAYPGGASVRTTNNVRLIEWPGFQPLAGRSEIDSSRVFQYMRFPSR